MDWVLTAKELKTQTDEEKSMAQPHIRVGRQGITEGIIKEIREQLSTTDPITVKLLPAFREANDRKTASQTIAEKTGSKVQSLVGGTLVLTRKHIKR